MEHADAAYEACPQDGYPEEGNELTGCQESWCIAEFICPAR
jgi:hypothetical protein